MEPLLSVAGIAKWVYSHITDAFNGRGSGQQQLPRLEIPEPHHPEPDYDICFVHGVPGNSKSTWTWISQDPNSADIRWPDKFLAEETHLPGSDTRLCRPRILYYEYETNVNSLAWLTARTLYYHADHLLEKLAHARRQDSDRPLLFVAHSLGGLLVKNALVFSQEACCKAPEAENQPNDQMDHRDASVHDIGNIYGSTFGIVSFGVPQMYTRNKPALAESVKALCRLAPPLMPKIQDFEGERWKRDVDTLRRRVTDYHPLAIEIPEAFCFESGTNPNPISPFETAVPPQLMGYASSLSRLISIPRDHLDLAKFSERDSVYWKLCALIQVFYNNADILIQERRKKKHLLPTNSEGTSMEHSAMYKSSEFSIEPELPKRIRFISSSDSRKELLNILQQRLSENHSAHLVGPTGSGKTSLAVEYAHLHISSYSSIFWLDARSERTLESSFVKVAHQLKHQYEKPALHHAKDVSHAEDLQKLGQSTVSKDEIPILEQDRESTVLDVLKWLECAENTHWLLIYEDVERPDVPFLERFLPRSKTLRSKRGYVLITSKNSHSDPLEAMRDEVRLGYSTAFLQYSSPLRRAFGASPTPEPTSPATIAEDFKDPIPVNKFSQVESVELLSTSLQARGLTDEQTQSVVPDLERAANRARNVPIELAYMGAFISVSDSPLQVPKLLADGVEVKVPEKFSVWFDTCLFLGPHPIPTQLVAEYFGLDIRDVDSDLEGLEKKGAVWREKSVSDRFRIPRLPLRSRIADLKGDRAKEKRCAERACQALVHYVKYLHSDNGPKAPSIRDGEEKLAFQHVDACFEHYGEHRDIMCEWDVLARLCESHGLTFKALVFYNAAKESQFTNTVTASAPSRGQRANLSDAALIDAWFEVDNHARNHTLAANAHSSAPLFTIVNVDTRNSRRLRNEIALIRMQVSTKNFEDPEAPLHTSSAEDRSSRDKAGGSRKLNNPIEGCLRIMGEVERRIEERYISIKGEVAQQLVLLSVLRGDWAAAVRYSRVLIDSLEHLFGPNGEETMQAVQKLAEIHMQQADFAGAISLLEQVLLTYERIFGFYHEKSIAIAQLLGKAFSEHKQYRVARNFYMRILDARKLELGNMHIETAKAQESLAWTSFMLNDKERAKTEYRAALQTARNFGENTPEYEAMVESYRRLFEPPETAEISTSPRE